MPVDQCGFAGWAAGARRRRGGHRRTAAREKIRNRGRVYSWHRCGNVPIISAVMANLYYNDRLVIAYTSLNPSDKQWSAGAEITWRRDGHRQSHSISGLTERFKTREEAERFVTALAKAWIDANP